MAFSYTFYRKTAKRGLFLEGFAPLDKLPYFLPSLVPDLLVKFRAVSLFRGISTASACLSNTNVSFGFFLCHLHHNNQIYQRVYNYMPKKLAKKEKVKNILVILGSFLSRLSLRHLKKVPGVPAKLTVL